MNTATTLGIARLFVLLGCLAAACSCDARDREMMTVGYELRSGDGTVQSRQLEMARRDKAEDVFAALLGGLRSATGTLTVKFDATPKLPMEIEGQVVDGRAEGPVRVFGIIEGRRLLLSETNFLHDRKHGSQVTYLPGGGVYIQGTWEHGAKTGHWSFHYRQGQPALEVDFRHDQFDGLATVFDANGREIARGRYVAGRPRDGTFIADPWELVRSTGDPSDTFETKVTSYSVGVRGQERVVKIAKTVNR